MLRIVHMIERMCCFSCKPLIDWRRVSSSSFSPSLPLSLSPSTVPSYWLPLLYHLKQKRQPESNTMQLASDGNVYDTSDLPESILSSSGVTGVRTSEDDLLDRLSLAETNEPYGGNRRYSELSASIPRWSTKWSRNGRYARQSRKPDAAKLAPFAAGNQHVVSFIQELFGSKDGRGVRFGLS